jgi:hypothetical protein
MKVLARPKSRAALAAALAAVLALGVLAGAARAASNGLLEPRGNNIWFGVSDTGNMADFGHFSESVDKHPAVIESFRTWGSDFHGSIERWQQARARPMIHITTADPNDGHELISLQAIAEGGGDGYLVRLNRLFASKQLPAYIRPLGEPNRCLNVWSAVNCDGTQKEGEHSTLWYKEAFRRIVTIVRGGQSLEGINATLAEIGLPPLNRTKGLAPESLPPAPVSIIWSPLPGGSPRVKGNFPGNYWPGSRWVDWVGTDFYSEYPVWEDLNRFYEAKQWKSKPVSITEWAVSGEDEPKFVKQLISWIVKRPRVRMLVYYQGFGVGNPYDLNLYPHTLNQIRKKIRRPNFLSEAEYNAGLLPPLPPKPKRK